VLELLGPDARELDEALVAMPDRPPVQRGRDNPLEVFSECFRIESAARIPALHCCLELFEEPPYQRDVLLRHRMRSISPRGAGFYAEEH
jgi:hypothetical protein